MTISDASEIQFWPTGEDSFNLEQDGYTDDYCFHQKFLCTGARRFQGYDTESDNDIYLFGYDKDGVVLFSSAFSKTTNQLFDPLADWTEFGGGDAWTDVGTSVPYVDLSSGSTYSNSLKTNIIPPASTSIRVVYDFENTVTAVDLVMRFRSGGSSVTPLPAGIPLSVGNTVGYFDITLDAAADDFYFEIQKSGGAATRVSPNSIKLYRTESATDLTVYNLEMIPSDHGMCDKFVSFKITNGVVASIENGDFTSTLAPSYSSPPGTNAWAWNAGSAEVTLPSAIDQTEVLNIPFSAIAGNTYNFELDVDVLVGAGSAGTTTRIAISFNDGVTLTDVYLSPTLDVGHYTLSISQLATNNWTQLQIIASVVGSSSYGRIVNINSISSSTDDGEEYYHSDLVEFVSSWANSNSEGRVDIQYKSIQNFADLIYDESSPYFMIQLDGRFRKEKKISTQKSLELTEMVINTAASVKIQRKLTLNDLPDYMHTKINLILAHSASGTVLVDGISVSVEEGYEEGSRPETYPLTPAEINLTKREYFKHNVI